MALVGRSVFAFFLILNLACVLSLILKDSQRQEFLDSHNFFRRQMNATSIRLMRWNCGLEKWAANYLKKCRKGLFGHSKGRNSKEAREMTGFDIIGENVYTIPAMCDTQKDDCFTNINNSVKYWYDEIKDYNQATAECKKGKVCGHFTQVVWDDTYELGCAVSRCYHPSWDKRKFVTGNWVVMCEYGRSGNWFAQKPPECPYMRKAGETKNCGYAGQTMFGEKQNRPWKGPKDCDGCLDSIKDGRFKGEKAIEWTKHCIDGLCSDTPEPPPLPKCTDIPDVEDYLIDYLTGSSAPEAASRYSWFLLLLALHVELHGYRTG